MKVQCSASLEVAIQRKGYIENKMMVVVHETLQCGLKYNSEYMYFVGV